MANQSASAYPILCASFNQDNSCFAIGTKNGFKIFDSTTGRLCYERGIGAYAIVEMLFTSSLLAIVGAGEQPILSPRRLCLYNTTTGNPLRELNFITSILAIRVNKQRLIVVLQEKTYVYDIISLGILDTIETVPNPKGLCAFSPSLDGCFLALPASTIKGSVLVYDVIGLRTHCEIDAHRSILSAIVLSSNGMYLATASEQGTIIRVHLVSEATKAYSFRRGTYPSTIFSLSFGSSLQLPDLLGVTSSSGSLHVFCLESAITQRSRRGTGFLGSIIPNSVNDALDPSNHHVLHNAFLAGVKSCTVIRKVDKISEATTSQESVACRATICIVTYNGYFLEYSLSINHKNEPSWTLNREFNLLTVVAADTPTKS
ncbi:autophagy-related protein 18b [Impatiens glandulifera]|uniref:autophagy-related protein 18b n=1 Tax=Impatiens glandulifera TaxID=253017 RepID=UPI001FB06CB5|nr:autophagy-related protein 18b [Impatiens glandulifera]